MTFRLHLFWALVLAVSLAASVHFGHTHAAMRTWAVLALVISLAPVAVWAVSTVRGRRDAARIPLGPVDDGPEQTEAALATTTGGN